MKCDEHVVFLIVPTCPQNVLQSISPNNFALFRSGQMSFFPSSAHGDGLVNEPKESGRDQGYCSQQQITVDVHREILQNLTLQISLI